MQPVQGNKRKTRRVLRFHACVSILCLFAWSGTALATPTVDTSTEIKRPIKHKKVSRVRTDHSHVVTYKPGEPVYKNFDVVSAPVPTCNEDPVAMKERLAEFDKLYGFKGYDYKFPSLQDSISKDYFCWRSTLAEHGFMFQAYNTVLGVQNMLGSYPAYGNGGSLIPRNYPRVPLYPSNQQYAGQRLTVNTAEQIFITYDLGRLGITGGQLQLGAAFDNDTWDLYAPSKAALRALAWYQPWFGGAVDTHIGFLSMSNEFVGAYVGGNYANPLGASASIPISMGMSLVPEDQPAAEGLWHITNRWYDELGIMRSMNPAGPTGNILYDDAYLNPDGLHFSVSNGGALVVNEFGYKNEAGVNDPRNWLRLGYMYNTSNFHDYSKGLTLTTGSQNDVSAYYALYDRQIWQMDPSSAATAYQGIYLGASYYYAPPSALVINQDIQVRLYGFGLIPGRPSDQVTLTFDNNQISGDFVDSGRRLGLHPYTVENVGQIGYTYKVQDGINATFGISYTDHPVITPSLLSPDAHALNFNFALTMNW
jgi:porin